VNKRGLAVSAFVLLLASGIASWGQQGKPAEKKEPHLLEKGGWRYSGTVDIPGQMGPFLAAARVDFRRLLDAVGAEGAVVDASLRLAEVSREGSVLNEVPFQFIPDPDFDRVTKPTGTVVFRVQTVEPFRSRRYFRLYFDTDENRRWPPAELRQTLPPPELVENGGFEELNAAGRLVGGWDLNRWSGARLVSSEVLGMRGVQLRSPHIGWSSYLAVPGRFSLRVDPNILCGGSFAIRGQNVSKGSVYAFLEWRNPRGRVLKRTMVLDGADAPNNWKTVSFEDRAPGQAVSVRLVFVCRSPEGSLTVDDVHLAPLELPFFRVGTAGDEEPAPEPPPIRRPPPPPDLGGPPPGASTEPRMTIDQTLPEPVAEVPEGIE